MRRFTLLALLALSVLAPCGCSNLKKNKADEGGSGFPGNPSRLPPSKRW